MDFCFREARGVVTCERGGSVGGRERGGGEVMGKNPMGV